MYYCPDCGNEFETPEKYEEKHGFTEPPYEMFLVCPNCKSTSFYLKSTTHCRCCGAKLPKDKTEFCSNDCKIKGMKLRAEQLKQKLLKSNGPLSTFVREIENQNNKYGTDYTYGQYVSLLKFMENKKKCNSRKRKKY